MTLDFEESQNSHDYAGCVKQNLGFIYLKKRDFVRFAQICHSCQINLSRALYGCVICGLKDEEFVSLQFVDAVGIIDEKNFSVISDRVPFLDLQNIELQESLISNFQYRQIQGYSRRATKSEVFQTLQRIIKLDTFDQFGDCGNKNDVEWLLENLFEYEEEMEFEFGNNGKLTEADIFGVEAENGEIF